MKKNILVLSTSFPSIKKFSSKSRGGHFLHIQCLCLINAGFNINVIAPLRINLPESEIKYGIKVTRFSCPFLKWTPLYQNRALYDIKNIQELISTCTMFIFYIYKIRKFVRNNHIDLIWALWLQIAYISYLAVGYKIPILVTIMGSDIRNFPSILTLWISRYIKNVFNMYQCDSEINHWIKKYRLKEIRVPNIYLNNHITKYNPTHIVVIGRLENNRYHLMHKGIGQVLFKIIKPLISKYSDLHVDIIGDGSMKKAFQHITKKYPRIHFLGWKENFDRYLSNACFVIGASGHGGTTLDTIPNKIPLLISCYDPVKNFWKDRFNCLIYNPDNPEQYKSTIQFALENKKLLHKIALNAKAGFKEYAVPINKGAVIWGEKLNNIILNNPF